MTQSLKTAGANPNSIDFVDGAINNEQASQKAVEAVGYGKASAAIVDSPFDFVARKSGLIILDLPDQPVIHNVTICADKDWIDRNEENTLGEIKEASIYC